MPAKIKHTFDKWLEARLIIFKQQSTRLLNSQGRITSRFVGNFKIIRGNLLNDEHALYVDAGVKGSKESSKAPASPYKYNNTMPPYAKIAKWGRESVNITDSRVIRAIQWSIGNTGLRATPFIKKATHSAFESKKALSVLEDEIAAEFIKDIHNVLK